MPVPARLQLAALLLGLASLACAQQRQRVAVIGGGVGGAAAAYYLRQELGPAADITVFERSRLGGRTEEVEVGGARLELGASIVWHRNVLVRDLAAAAGLEREAAGPPEGTPDLFAVYDGKTLVFEESSWRLLTILRLIWRYWISWWVLRAAPARAYDKFQGIYTLLDSGHTFERADTLLKAVGLYDLTQSSMFEWLREEYGEQTDLMASELVAGINRVNYNQNNLQINALAGLVSLLPATDPRCFRIRGGNSQLAPGVLRVANATVACPAAVASVRRLPDGTFQLELGQDGGGGPGGTAAQQGPFDAVIIATPLEASGLSLQGIDGVPHIPARKYQQTVTTIIKGAVRPSYFGLSDMTYSSIMVTEDAGVPWSSLSLGGRTDMARGNATLWKLFSAAPLPHAWLEMMFERGYEVAATRVWSTPGAYPAFDPPEDFAPFQLAEGLFYNNALENAASALEIAAIEGRMTALLAAQHLKAKAAHAAAAVLIAGGGAQRAHGAAAAA